ncbi:MAG: polyphenol oxidase family protein [Verrucomicrobiales bacterium]
MKFLALEAMPHAIVHEFVPRVAGVSIGGDRSEVLDRLWPHHFDTIQRLGFGEANFIRGEQLHGAEIAVVGRSILSGRIVPGVDGLVTDRPDTLLGIVVADCCAVYLVDRENQAIGLVHSGRRGTELGVVPAALMQMAGTFGSKIANVVVQLSPCIRPPDYEVDFADDIRKQCLSAGVPACQIHDEGLSTAADLTRFYSYRAEKGRTGRMLALLGLRSLKCRERD